MADWDGDQGQQQHADDVLRGHPRFRNSPGQVESDDLPRNIRRYGNSPGRPEVENISRNIPRYGSSPDRPEAENVSRNLPMYGSRQGRPETENVSRNIPRYGSSPGRTEAEHISRNLPRYGSSPGTSPTAHDNSVYSAVSSVENGAMTDESDYEDPEAPLDFSVGARYHQRRDMVDRRDRTPSPRRPSHNTSHHMVDHRDRTPSPRRPSHNTRDMPNLTRESINNAGYYSDGDTPRIKSEENSPVELNGLSSGSNGIRPRFGEKLDSRIGEPQLALRGMLPASVMPGMFPMFPAGAFNGLPGKQDSGTAPKAENGRSAKPVNFKERAPASGRDHPTGVSSIDLATAQMMAANSEDMFVQYRKYIMALQEQLRLQGSPGGSTSSSTSAGHNSDIHSAINSPTDRPDPHPDRSDTYPERPDMYEDPRHAPGARPLTPPSTTIPGSAASITGSRSLYSRVPSTHIRRRGRTLPEDQKDDTYWERRRKNNEAAKRSRDSRRAKEDEIAIRAAFLEQENLKLRVEVAALKNETAKLRCMLYNS